MCIRDRRDLVRCVELERRAVFRGIHDGKRPHHCADQDRAERRLPADVLVVFEITRTGGQVQLVGEVVREFAEHGDLTQAVVDEADRGDLLRFDDLAGDRIGIALRIGDAGVAIRIEAADGPVCLLYTSRCV